MQAKAWANALGLMILSVALGAQTGPNLLTNSGFEEQDAAGKPLAWSLSGKAAVVADERGAHSGLYYIRVRFDDSATQTVAVDPDSWYCVEGYVRGENPETSEVPRIKVYFYTPDGRTCLVSGGFIRRENYRGWQPFRVTIRSPQEAARVAIRLIGQFNGQDWFHFDDVTLRKIPLREWPLAAELPVLNGRTVVIPDLADVHSFALYRVPPASLAPIDGLLTTAAWTGRAAEIKSRPPDCYFDVHFYQPAVVSWMLIHTLSPEAPLGPARLETLPSHRFAPGRPFLDIPASDRPILSLQFPAQQRPGVRLHILGADRRTTYVHEIQVFGLRPGLETRGQPQRFGAAQLNETEMVALAAAYPVPDHRQALLAGGPPTESVALKAGRTLHLFVPVSTSEPVGVKALTLRLPAQGFKIGSIVEIAIKQPAELDLNLQWAEATDRRLEIAKTLSPRCYADLCRVLARIERDGLALTLDFPDLLLPPGEKLWLTLRADTDFTFDPQATTVALVTCAAAEAIPEYLPRLERLIRRLYSLETEAQAYDSLPYREMILYRLTERVLNLQPSNEPAKLIQRRMARRWWPLHVPRPEPKGAPDWAVWARHLAREWKRIADWWLEHRWVENGELGGNLNDDCEYTCHWPLIYLITGEERYRLAQRALADAVWEQSGGSGYSIAAMDVEHAAEDSSCTLPQMLLEEYGNPIHIERMMKMSEHIPWWTGINEQGRRHFRSYMFNTRTIKTEPPYDIDHLYCALAMCGATHLAWYCRNPQPLGWIREYAQAWAAVAMSTEKGKPVGALPCDVHFRTGHIAPYTTRWNESVYYSYGDYVMKYFLLGAQELLRDPALQPVVALQEPTAAQAIQRADEALARFRTMPQGDLAKPESFDRTWRGVSDETCFYRAAIATGKKEYVVAALRKLAEEIERSRWLLTAAEPFTDRIAVPGTYLLRYLYLGGDCAGKTHVPRLAVSWEGGGLDFAAFVLRNERDSLKLLVYNFRHQPLRMGLRVWRLEHGRYEIRTGIDADGDDVAEKPERRVQELGRYALVSLVLPPRKTFVVEAKQIMRLDPLESRADLALSRQDIRQKDARTVLVTIHNIGAAPAEDFLVQLQNQAGKILDTQRVMQLEPPADVKPRMTTVTLVSPKPLAQTDRIVVDLDNRVPEIYEGNNIVSLAPPPGRFVYLR